MCAHTTPTTLLELARHNHRDMKSDYINVREANMRRRVQIQLLVPSTEHSVPKPDTVARTQIYDDASARQDERTCAHNIICYTWQSTFAFSVWFDGTIRNRRSIVQQEHNTAVDCFRSATMQDVSHVVQLPFFVSSLIAKVSRRS